MAVKNTAPFHPIIYVRGFAATSSEIEDTVSDPYMGFNLGSTRARRKWTGETERFYFESPLVRLMSEYLYDDLFDNGREMLDVVDAQIPYRCVVIYRYYDDASEVFGSGNTPPIEHFAKGLDKLILDHFIVRFDGIAKFNNPCQSRKHNHRRRLPCPSGCSLHGGTGLPCFPAEQQAGNGRSSCSG